MNQRIEQLREQATDDILGVKIVDYKKFAELIVQDCVDILSEYSAQLVFHSYDRIEHPIQAIKKHFGTE